MVINKIQLICFTCHKVKKKAVGRIPAAHY
jgi:hypothetical protein